MSRVKKALIPAAGLGTRFLPATKTVPKEMLPLVDAPSLLFIVEEIVAAGIEDIIFVAGRHKNAIEDFFDISYEVEDTIAKAGKTQLLERLRSVRDKANFISIRQKEAKGLGHAIYTGRPIIGKEPFAALLGDEIMIGRPGVTEELCSAYEKSNLSTVAIMEVPQKDVSKYGIVAATKVSDSLFDIHDVVEKPKVENAPSRWALPGRYVFTAEIFDLIRDTKPGVNGEIQLTDPMAQLAKAKKLQAKTFQAKRYDAGDKFGFLQANIEIGLSHPEVRDELKSYIKKLAETLK